MSKQNKTALWKDVWRSIAHSKGRFVSIMCLMALGSFALVGLWVAGPDMRATGEAYYGDYKLADLTVLSDYGLTEDDENIIDQARGAQEIEYGYFKDVTISDTTLAVRIMSEPERVSTLELVDGRMPEVADEIAIDSGLAETYRIGDTIRVEEKPNAINDSTVLTQIEFTVVGHVNSPEIISVVNMGQSTAGTGSLKGYAVVPQETFDSDVYMTARLTFEDSEALDPYSNEYRDRVAAHKSELQGALEDRPAERLAEVKGEAQDEIDDGQAALDDAKQQLADAESQLADAKQQLEDAAAQIADGRATLASSVAEGQAKLDDAKAQLDAAAPQLASAKATLDDAATKISDGDAALASARAELAQKQAELAEAQDLLDDAKSQLDAGWADYDQNWSQVAPAWEANEAAWTQLDANRGAIAQGIAQCEAVLAADPANAQAQAQLAQLQGQQAALDQLDQLKSGYDRLVDAKATLDARQAEYDQKAQAAKEGAEAIAGAQHQIDANAALLATSREEFASGQAQYEAQLATYNEGVATYRAGVRELEAARAEGEATLADAQSAYDEGMAEYKEKLEEYNEALPDAQKEIADGEEDLADARERLEKLSLPAYETDTRREALGSDAYKTYDTVSEIIDSLARVFPVLLYLVAAFVTLSTMTRMVDEERINSGTLKALGYDDRDVALKFLLYGALAGGIGAVVGIVLGHTLLPWIVYMAYGHAFTLPPIQLGFYPGITVVALVLAGLCSVLPAGVAVRYELAEKPAQLLLPKPPKSGSKIFLERIGFVWRRLSFTHKVTARNLFRYKQRMIMTVLGVAGAVCMLVAGFGVQHSIQQMGERQFGQILRYDMIVAQTPTATDEKLAELDRMLDGADVAAHSPLHYESVSLVAGANGDTQEITLLVPDDDPASGSAEHFSDYVEVVDRKSGESIPLSSDGAVISERLATLCGVGVGDELTFEDSEGIERSVRVSGVCEMYMGHFIFMSREAYESGFGEDFAANAQLVRLEDGSLESVEAHAKDFMGLTAVQSVVQNTTLEAQIDTVVNSLDMIMTVLIVVATMLAVVIMYNLTNLNVSERMRELSTIKVLGFHSNETTMYIYRETMILTFLGLLAGYALGVALHQYILNVVPPDEVMFDPQLAAIEFAVPAVVIAAITLVLYFVELRRLRTVDMLEALKSVE